MSNQLLSSYFTPNRRYSRSINLERDAADAANLAGYVITERASQALERILNGAMSQRAASAWMLTGVYGTGKSAFGHFLTALFSPQQSATRKQAEALLKQNCFDPQTRKLIVAALPERGLVRAAATAQREPVSHTVVRALLAGVGDFWRSHAKVGIDLTQRLEALRKLQAKGKSVETSTVLQLVKEVSVASGTGVLLILDELGKSLEFAAQNRSAGDLYLLQQIAELNGGSGTKVLLIGLLHQAFSEYSYGLGAIERNEWAKIQGRFEELPFTESPSQMTHLIGQVIERGDNAKLNRELTKQAEAWHAKLSKAIKLKEITASLLDAAAPLHPVAALVLPQLCIRYAQNDRSLFTFLTSTEPHSLRTFLGEASLNGTQIPLLQLNRLYDYFIDSVGVGAVSRLNFQRWTEIKSLIDEHRHSEPDELRLLKTIGLLNLASTAGFLKATRQLVVLALCNAPDDRTERSRWERLIDALIERGIVIHRRQIDELRIWEGSDFNLETALTEAREQIQAPLAALLAEACPLRPVVAQRHSYQTGTLRFFERRYVDSQTVLPDLHCVAPHSDGLAVYWVDETPPLFVPALTADGKPLALIQVGQSETLRLRVLELMALKRIQATAAELQSDGGARRELRYRLTQARQLLDETFSQVIESHVADTCWLDGRAQTLSLKKELNARLSALCDAVYARGLTLLNELISRQEWNLNPNCAGVWLR